MSKLRLVFFGTSTFAVPSLEELAKERDIEIVGIVTQPDRPAGRGKKLTPPPVKRKAQELGLAPYECTQGILWFTCRYVTTIILCVQINTL